MHGEVLSVGVRLTLVRSIHDGQRIVMHTIDDRGDLALQGRGRRVRVRHPVRPPARGDPAAHPPAARRPRGHRAGDRVPRLRRAGGRWAWSAASRAGERSCATSPCRPATASTSRRLPAGTVDLSFNYPALPGQADLLRSALRELAASGDLEALLRYQPHRGRPQDRAAVARHLRRRGLAADADQVLIVNGSQHGLATTVMAALRAGDVVAVDALTYPGFKVLASTLRLELAPLPSTGGGTDLDALERLCAARPVRAVYVMPTLHNPLGWVMDAPARARLAEIARRHGLLIIEDASYAYLAEERAAADRRPRARRHRLRVRAVQERGDRAAGRLRRGPGRAGARDRARDPRDHLEHPGHDDRDRLPVAGRRHRRPPRGRQASRRQRPAVNRPRRPRRPARWSATRRPTSSGFRWRRMLGPTGSRRSSRARASRSPPPSRTRPPRPRRRRFDWRWARPTSTACVRRWARCERPSRPIPTSRETHPPRLAEGYLRSRRKHLGDGALQHAGTGTAASGRPRATSRSRNTASWVTSAPWRWSGPTARSTGTARRGSTRRRCSAPCSTPARAAISRCGAVPATPARSSCTSPTPTSC